MRAMNTKHFAGVGLALVLALGVPAAHADLPEHRIFAAAGERLLLWVSSERGRTEPELHAAGQLAARGVETWSLDPVNAYFLPQLPRSMDAVPTPDMVEWLRAALARGKPVTVYAVARAAVPVLRAAAALAPAERVSGFVYFPHPAGDPRQLTLQATFVAEDGAPVATVAIPFEVARR